MAAQPEAEVKYFLLFPYDPGCSEAELDAFQQTLRAWVLTARRVTAPDQSTCLLLTGKAPLCLIVRDGLLQ
jgi:hypothetical protein